MKKAVDSVESGISSVVEVRIVVGCCSSVWVMEIFRQPF